MLVHIYYQREHSTVVVTMNYGHKTHPGEFEPDETRTHEVGLQLTQFIDVHDVAAGCPG